MTVTINLNEYVKFKLTDKGKDIFYHQYDAMNAYWGRQIIEPHFPKTDDDGYVKMQLHEVMRLYGNYMKIGDKSVIENNEILYED